MMYDIVDGELFKDYTDNHLHDRNYEPIFIKLNSSPFRNWIISIEDIKKSGKFGYSIATVPQDIDDSFIESHRKELGYYVQECFEDMVMNNKEEPTECNISKPNEFLSYS